MIHQRRLETLRKKAWTYFEAGEIERAAQTFDKAAALVSEPDVLELECGVMFFRAERFEAARERFERALAQNPGNVTAAINLAKTLLRLGRAAEGLEQAERALERHPEETGLWVAAGLCERESKGPEPALERFRKAAALSPREATPKLHLAESLRALGRLEEALCAAREACVLSPGSVPALFERGRCLFALGRFLDAWEQFVAAIKLRGAERADRALLLAAAAAAIEIGQASKALELAELLIGRDRDDEEAWALKARAYAARGEAAKAAVCRATAHMIAGSLEEALSAFDEALRLQPEDPAAWCNRGVVLERLGRYDDALRCYERGLEVNPRAPQLWHNRGVLLLERLDRRAEAIRSFREEVRLDHRRFFELQPEVRRLLDGG